MRQRSASRLALTLLVLATPRMSHGISFPGEPPCSRDVIQTMLPETPGILLGITEEELVKARPAARHSERTDDTVEPPAVLHNALLTRSVRTSAWLQDRTVFGRKALVSYRLYDGTLGAVTVSLHSSSADEYVFTTWADVERQLTLILGEPTLRSTYCLTKSCGDAIDLGRARPEDVASRVGNRGYVGLHSVWGLCPVRVRLVASHAGVHVSFENRHLEQALRDAYFAAHVTSAPRPR